MDFQQVAKRYKLHHLVLWLLFFAGWYLFRAADFPDVRSAIIITAIKVFSLIILVYLTNYFLIPFFLYKKKYIAFSFALSVAVAIVGFGKVYLISAILRSYYRVAEEIYGDYKERIYDNIIPLFLLISTGAAIKLVLDYINTQKKLAAISQEKAETELQYLRSQINPHFVFNTLNAIYFQIDKTNTDARETLIEFSDLLRYQLYECNADTITIEKEMAYLQDYINLQQKRKDENYKVGFYRSDELKAFEIVPLLLIPFVENAFKHVSHFAERPNEICIRAETTTGMFIFSVKNTKEPAQLSRTDQVGGIGLKNVQRRLHLLYPGRHSLHIDNGDQHFQIKLTITL